MAITTTAEYDQAARERARDVGAPTPRMASGAATLVHVHREVKMGETPKPTTTQLIWFDAATGSLMCRVAGQTRFPAYALDRNHGSALGVMIRDEDRVVFADREAFKATRRLVDRNAKQSGDGRFSRTLAVAASLPVSTRFPVLTDLLSARLWLPAGLDTNSFDAWAHALAFSGAPASEQMDRALAMVSDGWSNPRLVKAARSEFWSLRSAEYAGLSAACSAYGAVEQITDCWAATCAADEGLRERNVLDGTVSRVLPQSYCGGADREMVALVSSPFRLKVGRAARFLWNGDGADVTVAGLEVSGSDLAVTFELPTSRRGSSGARMHSALDAGTPMFVTSKPFDGVGAATPGGRKWAAKADEGWAGAMRDVPVDVALAGAN